MSTSSSAVLSWFAGNGSFGFSTFHLVPSTYNNTGERLISGDFDGDGLVDLVMSHTAGVRVFPNPGTGNFQNTFDLPITEHDVAIQAADVTGDGVLDLLVLSDSGHFSVWRGLGNATFTLQFETTPGGFTRDMSVGDLNRDGFLDVVMPTYSAFLILYGQSGGTFGNAQTIASGLQPATCSVGDWNHDGWLDVAVSCNNAGGQAYLSVHEQIPHAIQSVCVPGTGGVVACPCGNTGLAGRGCANSIDASGALLTATGTSNPDTIVLHAAGMTLSASPASVLVQSTTVNTAGVAFGDGSRCVAGSLLRIGVKAMPSGTVQYPQAGDASISTKGFVTPGSGQTRFYQWYYRDSTISFCSAGTFNISNGVAIVW